MTKPTALDYVTCEFGRKGSWSAGYHTGVDYRAAPGTKIHATYPGKVIHAGWGGKGTAYGIHVVIESVHNGQTVQHLYAHLSKVNINPGKRARAGRVIGYSGVTGNITGPHLHYEERVSPFGYWNHRRPELIAWQPLTKKVRKRIRKIIARIKK